MLEEFLKRLEFLLSLPSQHDDPDHIRANRIFAAIVDLQAAEQSVHPTSEHSTAAFSNSYLNGDEREDSNPLFFTRG